MTHICVGRLTMSGADNGLSPSRRQAIIWTNAGILLIRRLGTNLGEIVREIGTFSFKKMHLKMSSGKWRPFCPGLNVFKGSNMIVCVLLVSISRGCCLAAPGDHEGDYNMMPPFFSTATNILLIKSNLKFESRATAVSVAMSPRYLGGKYRSRLHPRSRKCVCLFCGRLGVWHRTAPDRRHLLPVATTKLIMRCV